MIIQATYARVIFLNVYEDKAAEILCRVSSAKVCMEFLHSIYVIPNYEEIPCTLIYCIYTAVQ